MLCCANQAAAAESATLDTIVRAETDTAFRGTLKLTGGLNKLVHLRQPTPIDKQTIIRMNRDTLYSAAVLDLSKPVTVVLPETGGRYLSMHVINQDHYMYVVTKPGRYRLTQKEVGTRYAQLTFRTFVDANEPADINAANAIQDKIKVSGGGNDPLDMPEWDQAQLETARKAANLLATMGLDTNERLAGRAKWIPSTFLLGL
jgi:hypothetical protein